jgi:uncharacterized protein DUF4382
MASSRCIRYGTGVAAVVLLAACSGESGAPETSRGSTLEVSLMDAPVDGVTAVKLRINSMWLKGPNGPATQLPMTTSPITVDLLASSDKNAALLIDDAPIPAGNYEWLRMDVAAEFDGVMDSYVMTDAGGQEEIRVPSGSVRLVSGFAVESNQAVRLLFDWDLRKGLVDPPGQPGFLLKPAFRVIDVTELGELSGAIATANIVASGDPNGCATDDADLDVGNIVYVFAGKGVTPDDVDGIAAEPAATAAVTQNTAGDYVYRVVLEPGDYSVAFTCQAADDDPEVDESVTPDPIAFLPAVDRTVTAGEKTIANL